MKGKNKIIGLFLVILMLAVLAPVALAAPRREETSLQLSISDGRNPAVITELATSPIGWTTAISYYLPVVLKNSPCQPSVSIKLGKPIATAAAPTNWWDAWLDKLGLGAANYPYGLTGEVATCNEERTQVKLFVLRGLQFICDEGWLPPGATCSPSEVTIPGDGSYSAPVQITCDDHPAARAELWNEWSQLASANWEGFPAPTPCTPTPTGTPCHRPPCNPTPEDPCPYPPC